MGIQTLIVSVALFLPASTSFAQEIDPDFSGTGRVLVIRAPWALEPPPPIGCIRPDGKFITDFNNCGIFTAPPFALKSSSGTCANRVPFPGEQKLSDTTTYSLKCIPDLAVGDRFYSLVGD
jgi:hypothetical protein